MLDPLQWKYGIWPSSHGAWFLFNESMESDPPVMKHDSLLSKFWIWPPSLDAWPFLMKVVLIWCSLKSFIPCCWCADPYNNIGITPSWWCLNPSFWYQVWNQSLLKKCFIKGNCQLMHLSWCLTLSYKTGISIIVNSHFTLVKCYLNTCEKVAAFRQL